MDEHIAPLRAGPDHEERRPVVAHEVSLDVPPVLPRGVLRPRERQVLRLRFRGLTVDEVADELRILPQTVKNYVSDAYRALGVDSLIEAAMVLGYLRFPEDDPAVSAIADRIRRLRTADVTIFSDTSDLVAREDVLAILEGRG